MTNSQNEIINDGVAVIGMAGRFPGAESVDELWRNLCRGDESITYFSRDELDPGIDPRDINNPNYVRARGVLKDADKFDAAFFEVSPREAGIMDPQHRIFLEMSWAALENAGYYPDSFNGMIGVFAGMGNNTYFAKNVSAHPELIDTFGEFQARLVNEKDFLSTRVSYALNLKGPSVNIYTACSTSLVSVCYAFDSLMSYQCDMALAGGISITFPQNSGYIYREGAIHSADGHCRPFDKEATGTVLSSGGGIVVLKRLEDALQSGDHIYGVIRGTAVNNDGAGKMSFMAPSVDGQADAIALAQASAGIDPETISYIETHGTATPIGDPIEIKALTKAFQSKTEKKAFCGIGSIKSNLGHLDAAAGIAGLIKTILSLEHRMIPATLHYHSPNPEIDFADSPFYVHDKLIEWAGDKTARRAGVSSFGIGGTNAHVVIEEAPEKRLSRSSRPKQLLLLSARTESTLDSMTENLKKHLIQNPDVNIADAAYTLQIGRQDFDHRRIAVCEGAADAVDALESSDASRTGTGKVGADNPSVAFMFPGQGSQYINMGLNFYQHGSVFRDIVDDCAAVLKPILGRDIRKIIYPEADNLQTAANEFRETRFNQPALFMIEYALAKLWNRWGVSPDALVGHSIGEYSAACLSGVFSVENALKIVATRGRLMQELPEGSMLAVMLPVELLEPMLSSELSIAAVNSPASCVATGPKEAIERLRHKLETEDIQSRKVETSHAFHSQMMAPVIAPFKKFIMGFQLHPPKIPFVSTVTGTWIRSEQAIDPEYWAGQIRATVRFADGIQTLREKPERVLLEVGPRRTASTLALQQIKGFSKKTVIASLSDTDKNNTEWNSILTAMGELWLNGISFDWEKYYADEKRVRIPLPTYPFERKRYWLESPGSPSAGELFRKGNKHERLIQKKISEDISSLIRPFIPNGKALRTSSSSSGIEKGLFDTDSLRGKDFIAPATETEKSIAVIWQELLGIDHISVNDNYFNLGGDSLSAVSLFTIINRRTGKNLPLATLIDAPTLGKLSSLIDNYSVLEIKEPGEVPEVVADYKGLLSNPWPSLVAIQPEGNRPPFFCFHGVGGNVLNYSGFIPYLGPEQPLYGLQSQGLDGVTEPFKDIETMAKHYITEIRAIQPHGPYFLGGGSMGGLLALEAAQQFQRDGEAVRFLAMFDTYGPHHSGAVNNNSLSQNLDNYLKTLSGSSIKQKHLIIYRSISSRFKSRIRMITCLIHRELSKPIPHNLRYWYLEQKNLKMIYRYKAGRYNGKIWFFRATDTKNDIDYDPTNGWEGMATDGIKIFEIPGNHANIVEQPLLREKLNESLRQAQKHG